MASISSVPAVVSLADLIATSPSKSKGKGGTPCRSSVQAGTSQAGTSQPVTGAGRRLEERDEPASSPPSDYMDMAANLQSKLDLCGSDSDEE